MNVFVQLIQFYTSHLVISLSYMRQRQILVSSKRSDQVNPSRTINDNEKSTRESKESRVESEPANETNGMELWGIFAEGKEEKITCFCCFRFVQIQNFCSVSLKFCRKEHMQFTNCSLQSLYLFHDGSRVR